MGRPTASRHRGPEPRAADFRDPITTLIRGMRSRRGLSLLALGKRVDASAPHLYNIEAGRKLPSEELAARIGQELGLDPEAFRAWVRAAGRSDWNTTREATILLERFIRDPEVAELLSEAGFAPEPSHAPAHDRATTMPSGVARPVAAVSSVRPEAVPRLAAAAEPLPRVASADGGPARVLVPVLDPGADPERARAGHDGSLRLDPAALSGFESLERPFAYALGAGRFPRAGRALPDAGHVVLTLNPGWPPRQGALYAARHEGRIELTPAIWNGTHLLLLPPPGSVDFVALPVAEEPTGREVLRGRVVLVVG